MRLGIVADFTDRASKRMMKLLRANQKMEKANKNQAKMARQQARQAKATAAAQGKLANQVSRTNRLMSALKTAAAGIAGKISSAASAMGRFVGSIARAIRRVASLEASLSRVRRGLSMMKNGGGKIARGVMVAGGLAAGATAAAAGAANMVVGPAAQMEKFQTILETTTGSVAKAKEAMAWVTDFAVRTPYELNQVMEGFVQLRNYGLEPTNGLLKTLGDTSAAMGKPLMQAVEAMADAVTGENERLKEFGIKAKKAGKYFYYEYTQNGVTKVAKALASDRAAIQQALTGIFNVKYGGAMDRLSRTWEGLINNLKDMWFKFRLMIADSGVFDWAKGKLRGFLDMLNQLEANGSLATVAKEIGDNIIATLEVAWTVGQGLYQMFKQIGAGLAWAADALGGWNRLVGVFLALPLLSTIAGIITGFAQLAGGLMLLGSGLATLSLPVIGIIAGIAAVAAAVYLIYENWDGIVDYFSGVWDGIVASAHAAWEWIRETFSWHPLVLITENWGAITDWFSGFWDQLVQVVQSGWAKIKGLFDVDWLSGLSLEFRWPELPDFSLPDFASLMDDVKFFFSLDWLPEWEWPEIPMPDLPDLSGAIDSMVDTAGAAWNRVRSIFSDDDPISIAARDPASIERATQAANHLRTALDQVANVDVSPAMTKMDQVRNKANGLPPIVQSAMDRVSTVLASVDFAHHGRRMMDTIAAGMRARAHVVVAEMRRVTQQLRDHLPSSPAKVGPLSDIHRLKFGETIAQSIRPAPMVKAMRNAAAATIAAASIASPSLAASSPAAVSPSPAALSVAQPGVGSANNAASGGATVSITFAPSITVGAGSSVSQADLVDLLEDQADELVALIERKLAEKRRLDF